MAEININIAGDFIDSFIYSGVLFTVDTNGILFLIAGEIW